MTTPRAPTTDGSTRPATNAPTDRERVIAAILGLTTLKDALYYRMHSQPTDPGLRERLIRAEGAELRRIYAEIDGLPNPPSEAGFGLMLSEAQLRGMATVTENGWVLEQRIEQLNQMLFFLGDEFATPPVLSPRLRRHLEVILTPICKLGKIL